ncbi:protein-disulfide reductase DsbD [Alcaligenes endophyticus]|uniref:Protein-disulfide reductase DsbD n=1 Tax=Alcaligenes endophyticus TaxID=1929088 RepID=A0ABT8EEP9_9BURK|nr:protein-disulfide reductase DsbD [Alcaligenes endophyticus]MCX5592316.1 protein-disulfide reductase DsbD [Alcaligenes endophyticus]MDN4119759.1 protein-disulfide reductase DsbD [Alcaligenes endophyticus]
MALNLSGEKVVAVRYEQMMATRILHALFIGLLACVLLGGKAFANEDYLDPDDAFRLRAAVNEPNFVDIHFEIAPDYYMYRERFELGTDAGAAVGELQSPTGIRTYDPNFDKEMEVYRHGVSLRVPLNEQELTGAPIRLTLTSQGCADAGLCYTPSTQELQLIAGAQGYEVQGAYASDRVPTPEQWAAQQATATQAPSTQSAFSLSDVGLAQYLKQASWLEIVFLSFVFGALLSFTPCVLPMVPILLAIIAGQKQEQPRRRHGFLMAVAFVLGLSLVYTLLGVAAGLLGAGLAAWLQTPWVLGLFAVLLGVFGLAMLDVFTLQAPAALQGRLSTRLQRIPGGKFGGVFTMGMLSALIVGPCVAAPLAGVLLFISQTGDVVLGGSALFALAWGSGLLLLVLGASSGALMPKAGAWMNHIKTIFALMLFATAWWMVAPVLPAWLGTVGWALLLFWSALLLGLLWRGASSPIQALRQALALILALWASLTVLSIAVGAPSVLQPLHGLKGFFAGTTQAPVSAVHFERIQTLDELEARVAAATKPVMLDFYADWCVSCIEMEKFTFTDAQVAQRMQQFELLQVDVTANTAEDRALLKRFSLFGPPGILFFNTQGDYLEQWRVIGFKNAAEFGRTLDQVLQAS